MRRCIALVATPLVVLLVANLDHLNPASAAFAQQGIYVEPPLMGPVQSIKSDLRTDRCYAFSLLEKRTSEILESEDTAALLSWTTSGVIRDDRFLYLTDSGFDRLARLKVGGYVETAATSLRWTNGKSEELIAPFYIYPRMVKGKAAGYVLLDVMDESTSQVLFVDRQNNVEDALTTGNVFLRKEDGDQVVLMDVLRMVPVSDGLVVNADFISVEGYVARRGDDYWNSFAYLDRGAKRGRYIPLALKGPPIDDPKELKEKFYGRDFSLMTIIDDVAYVLVMVEKPWIGVVDLGTRTVTPLPDFPADLTIPNFLIRDKSGEMLRGVDRLYKVYSAIQNHSLPIGLYSWNDRLFILWKSRADERNGNTEWQLVEVSKETGEDLNNRVTLPTRAEDIALVLGDEYFGIIEKGPIDRLTVPSFPWSELYRPTRAAVIVPVEAWLAPDSNRDPQECREVLVGPERTAGL